MLNIYSEFIISFKRIINVESVADMANGRGSAKTPLPLKNDKPSVGTAVNPPIRSSSCARNFFRFWGFFGLSHDKELDLA